MATVEAPTLTALLKVAAAAFPSRRAVAVPIPSELELTHAALDALVDAAAARLAAGAGILPGHVVALAFPTNTVEVELVIMFLAVVRARAVAAPLGPALTQEELEVYLSDIGPRLLITSAEGNATAQAAAEKLGLVHVAASLPDAGGRVHLAGLPADSTAGNGNGSECPGFTADHDPSDVALLVYTTSRREVVPLTQRDLAGSVQNVRCAYHLVETDATVAAVPLLHVHGLLCVLLSSLASGASVSLPATAGRFSASAFWADMRASGATWYTAVPTVHPILLDHHASKPEAPCPALRFVGSCGASLAPETFEKLEAVFGAPVLEAAHLMTPNPLPQDDKYAKGFSVEKKTTGGPAGGANQNNGGFTFTEPLRHGLPVLGLCVASVAVAGLAAGAATPPATGLGLFVMLIVGLSTLTIRVLRA